MVACSSPSNRMSQSCGMTISRSLRTNTFEKPPDRTISRYSSFCMAPETHPTYASAAFWMGSGMVPSSTMSEMLKCPPDLSTRKISANAVLLSGTRLSTQLESTTSNRPDSSGMSSMSPTMKSIFSHPIFSALARAFRIIASEKSRPVRRPVSPTNERATKMSFPAPLPRSSTDWPGLKSANSTGMPHPRLRSASRWYPFCPS